jgi:hypothetical protein
MLKNWIGNEQVILNQTRGSRRRFYRREAKFPEHDKLLYKEFEEARGLGRQITHRWIMRHAKALYRKLYPYCCLYDPITRRWRYLDIKFSNGWF